MGPQDAAPQEGGGAAAVAAPFAVAAPLLASVFGPRTPTVAF